MLGDTSEMTLFWASALAAMKAPGGGRIRNIGAQRTTWYRSGCSVARNRLDQHPHGCNEGVPGQRIVIEQESF
jgi:hypothetical protein